MSKQEKLVSFQLANYEVVLPQGKYDAQYQSAKEELEKAKRHFRDVQKICAKKNAELDVKEAQLKARSIELRRMKEHIAYLQHLGEQAAMEKMEQEQKVQQSEKVQLQALQDAVTEIVASSALLSVVQERERQYAEYSKVLIQVYEELTSTQTQGGTDQFVKLQQLQDAQLYIRNLYRRLQIEQRETIKAEQGLQQQLDDLQHGVQTAEKANAMLTTVHHQKIQEYSIKLEKQKYDREFLESEILQLQTQLSTRSAEISEAFTSIDTLCNKVEFSNRQTQLAEKMSVFDLIGERNSALEELVEEYYAKSQRNVDKNECAKRILGAQVVQKLQNLQKLSLWIQDAQQLLKICEQERSKLKK